MMAVIVLAMAGVAEGFGVMTLVPVLEFADTGEQATRSGRPISSPACLAR